MSASPESNPRQGQIPPVAAIPIPGRITAISREQYIAKAGALRRYSVAKRSIDPEEPVGVSILEAVEDLIARTDLSPSSKAAYRSAMLWYLQDLQDQSEQNRLAFALLQQMTRQSEPAAKAAPTRKKAITEADYNALIEELGEMSTTSIWARRTAAWVQATLATGARPIEWLDAGLDATKTRLTICTAKQHLEAPRFLAASSSRTPWGEEPTYIEGAPSTGRSPEAPEAANDEDDDGEEDMPLRVVGKQREVPLRHPSDQFAAEMHLGYFNTVIPPELDLEKRLTGFRKYHDQCRIVLRNACRRLWKGRKNYTLYTFRSQFQANQRAVLGAAGAAGLMGHSDSSSPSTAHYGKATQAFARFKSERAATGGHDEAPAEHAGDAPTEASAEAP